MRSQWRAICLLLGWTLGAVAEESPTTSAQVLFQQMTDAVDQRAWRPLLHHASALSKRHPEHPLAADALYYSALAKYQLRYEAQALEDTEAYLHTQNPRFYRESLELRLLIAEAHAGGARAPLFEHFGLFRVASPNYEKAAALFQEMIAASPDEEMTIRALLGLHRCYKGSGDTRAAAEVLQRLMKRFPRDPAAQEAYVLLAQMYAEQSDNHFHDPVLMDAAQLNLAKFQKAFPTSPRLKEAEEYLHSMRERYAEGALETARFYERIHRYTAAAVYYASILRTYPETRSMSAAKQRLVALHQRHPLPEELQEWTKSVEAPEAPR